MNASTIAIVAAGLAATLVPCRSRRKSRCSGRLDLGHEANNVRYIAEATAAAEKAGWTVSVIDAAGSADQANSAIQNFARPRRWRHHRHGLSYSSIARVWPRPRMPASPWSPGGGGLGLSVAATMVRARRSPSP